MYRMRILLVTALCSYAHSSIACSCLPDHRNNSSFEAAFNQAEVVVFAEIVNSVVTPQSLITTMKVYEAFKGNKESGATVKILQGISRTNCERDYPLGARVIYFGLLKEQAWTIPHVCSPGGLVNWLSSEQRILLNKLSELEVDNI